MDEDDTIIGGIEGGATHSNIILLNAKGKVIASAKGNGTNHQLVGMQECQNRIADMVNAVKKEANLSLDQPLLALGLSLSGCEHNDTNQELVKGLLKRFPNLSEQYAIGSDTEGSIAATSNQGGIVCISGTGSNTLLINSDGRSIQCGGWGNVLGDEGSGYAISHRGVKICIDALDNFKDPPYDIDRLWKVVQDHFNIKTKMDLLGYFYTNFDKAYIASLCKKMCALAREGDQLSKFILEEAGTDLARSVSAVIPHASPKLVNRRGGIHVLAVGSVWNSWDLLKPGFVKWLTDNTNVKELSLMKLTTTMAVGAAYMAADKLQLSLPRTYPTNYEIFYKFER